MKEQTIENETRLYLFDLMNAANENGFKPEDNWELDIVTEEDRHRIQRDYKPAVVLKPYAENLLQVFQSVKSKLNQPLNQEEQLLNSQTVLNYGFKYIVAYNAKHQRR
ncbi:hypothetical protein KHS38_07580 [Mucilaginibacter sp. Bleaf8]|uniref:hypothetical protein n=1 Tax=Mucilaginibacter sp. Bleaf8 TaxID=2834430 RepID=UPI001BCB0B86|nr:hypothetical protein [Mucilaginibacter sp. Bleaf8]MBS7564262.1 hypothetical protein [Mucilaginibacter sp. Bleaf8]